MNVCQYCGLTEKDKKIIRTKRFGEIMTLCQSHYYQMVRKGEFRRKRTEPNEYIVHEDCIEMFLYNKVGEIIEKTYFSKEHLPEVIKYIWSINNKPNRYTKYVDSKIDGKKVSLHSFIAKILYGERQEGLTVDHINQNGLDNRNENLRYTNQTQQNINQKIRKDNVSGVKGVSYYKKINKWIAQMKHHNTKMYETFNTLEEAIEKRKYWEELRDRGEII